MNRIIISGRFISNQLEFKNFKNERNSIPIIFEKQSVPQEGESLIVSGRLGVNEKKQITLFATETYNNEQDLHFNDVVITGKINSEIKTIKIRDKKLTYSKITDSYQRKHFSLKIKTFQNLNLKCTTVSLKGKLQVMEDLNQEVCPEILFWEVEMISLPGMMLTPLAA